MEIGCSCVCSIDGESADVSNVHWPKARKEHTCCECGAAIIPGQRYERASGLWDGSWDTYKTCKVCVSIRDDLCPRGFEYTFLRETIWECFGLDYVTGELYGEDD